MDRNVHRNITLINLVPCYFLSGKSTPAPSLGGTHKGAHGGWRGVGGTDPFDHYPQRDKPRLTLSSMSLSLPTKLLAPSVCLLSADRGHRWGWDLSGVL